MCEVLEKFWNGYLKVRLKCESGGKLYKEVIVLELRRDDEQGVRFVSLVVYKGIKGKEK